MRQLELAKPLLFPEPALETLCEQEILVSLRPTIQSESMQARADITTGVWRSSYVRHKRRRQITDPTATAMAQKQTARRASMAAKAPAGEVLGWSELWQKEDWWAIWLGLGLVIAAIVAYLAGGTIKPLAVKPATWDSFTALRDHFAAQY